MIFQLYIDKNGVTETNGLKPTKVKPYNVVGVTICKDGDYCGYVNLEHGGAYTMSVNMEFEFVTYMAYVDPDLDIATIAVNIDKK